MEVIKYEDLKQFYDYYETQVYEDNEQVFGLIMQELVKIIPNLESEYAEDVTQYSDKVLIFKTMVSPDVSDGKITSIGVASYKV